MKKRTKPRVHGTFIRDNFNEPIVIVIVHARHGHRENVQRFCLDNYNLSITNNNAEIKTLLLHPTLNSPLHPPYGSCHDRANVRYGVHVSIFWLC